MKRANRYPRQRPRNSIAQRIPLSRVASRDRTYAQDFNRTTAYCFAGLVLLCLVLGVGAYFFP